LATLEKERGHLRQTEEHLRRALEIDSENLHCLTAWGELWTSVYKDCGRQDAAEETEWAFKQALAVDGTNSHALVGYARLLSLLERFQEADAYLKQAIKLPGKTAETLVYVSTVRGESAVLQGDYQRAVREFEAARSKGALAAYTALAKVLAQENLARARRLLKEAHDLEPNNVIVYNAEAGIEEEYGDKAKAQAAFERSLAIDPENAYTHWRYAELLERLGEQEEADSHLRRAEDLGFALSELSLWSKGSLRGTQTTETPSLLDDDSLYERYGKPLEKEHRGKYIAINQDGRAIVDSDDLSVIGQAINTFGSGNFVFRRIGYSYVWKLRWGHVGQQGLSVSAGKSHYP
jgi:Tfp pilus assembly protein PilF